MICVGLVGNCRCERCSEKRALRLHAKSPAGVSFSNPCGEYVLGEARRCMLGIFVAGTAAPMQKPEEWREKVWEAFAQAIDIGLPLDGMTVEIYTRMVSTPGPDPIGWSAEFGRNIRWGEVAPGIAREEK